MLKIVPFNASHLQEIAALERECFSIPWSASMFEEELKSTLAHYFVALQDGEVIGYAGMWKILDEGHITNIAVSPRCRTRGIGGKLLETLISLAAQFQLSVLLLEVRESNAAARSLYAKRGFVQTGLRKGYYHDNHENAVLMTLTARDSASTPQDAPFRKE
jgi:ribosomal-protein-alanine N-acetyltransferase